MSDLNLIEPSGFSWEVFQFASVGQERFRLTRVHRNIKLTSMENAVSRVKAEQKLSLFYKFTCSKKFSVLHCKHNCDYTLKYNLTNDDDDEVRRWKNVSVWLIQAANCIYTNKDINTNTDTDKDTNAIKNTDTIASA